MKISFLSGYVPLLAGGRPFRRLIGGGSSLSKRFGRFPRCDILFSFIVKRKTRAFYILVITFRHQHVGLI